MAVFLSLWILRLIETWILPKALIAGMIRKGPARPNLYPSAAPLLGRAIRARVRGGDLTAENRLPTIPQERRGSVIGPTGVASHETGFRTAV